MVHDRSAGPEGFSLRCWIIWVTLSVSLGSGVISRYADGCMRVIHRRKDERWLPALTVHVLISALGDVPDDDRRIVRPGAAARPQRWCLAKHRFVERPGIDSRGPLAAAC